MLGLAIRRWCAPLLDLEPHATPDAYLARRRELGAAEVNTRFLGATGTGTFLVDTGLTPGLITSPSELAALGGGTGHEIVRLEAVGEAVLADGVAHPVVNGWLAWTAVELGLPLQFHVGYGDNDVDLADCDPLRLTGFLRATADRGVPVLLLHTYPFHRNAAYLAQVFDHVFMDVSLATHNSGALAPALLRESFELVPFGKMLFASDAYGLAELYYLGTMLFRRGLGTLLDGLVDAGEMTSADASYVAALVGSGNARRVYHLQDDGVAG
jgi:hypothetical protein